MYGGRPAMGVPTAIRRGNGVGDGGAAGSGGVCAARVGSRFELRAVCVLRAGSACGVIEGGR